MQDEYSQDFDFVKYTDIRDAINEDKQARMNAFAHSPEEENIPDEPAGSEDGSVMYEDEPVITDEQPAAEVYDEDIDEPDGGYPDEEQQLPVSESAADEEAPADAEAFEREYEFDREHALEQIKLAKQKRELADQIAKDRLHAEILMVAAAIILVAALIFMIVHFGKKKSQTQTFANISTPDVTDSQEELKDLTESMGEPLPGNAYDVSGHTVTNLSGITFVDDIMIVNKTYGLPSTYNPGGLDPVAEQAFYDMSAKAWGEGITLWICSGFRSYEEQEELFEQYAAARGLDEADSVSARPGHSEHQSGLCMDVNSTDFSFENTAEAQWLEANCAEFGFIIRFPKGKEYITGYAYEPWHIRYVGVEAAQAIKASGKCLEEYLGVTSNCADAADNEAFLQRYAQYANIHPDSSADASSASEWDNAYDNNYGNDWGYDDNWGYDYGNDWGNGYDDYNYDYDYGYDDNNWYYDEYTY